MEHWEFINQKLTVVSETPEQLWQNAVEYFKWSDSNPIKQKFTPRTGKLAGIPQIDEKVRIYSIKALCLHCGFDEEYLRDVRASKTKDNIYYQTISKILYIIYVQNLELTAVDVLNPIFMSKVLNIDKEEKPTSAIKVILEHNVPALSTSESEILEKLELEYGAPENIKEQSAKEQ